MKKLSITVSLLFAVASLFLFGLIIVHSKQNQINKNAYAELNHVKYGLFSVDAWKDQLLVIVRDEFNKLYVSKETEVEMRVHVSAILNKMIDEVAAKVKKENQKSASGKVKQLFINTFVDIKDIKKGIPEYTDAVIRELKKPQTKNQIKDLVNDQLTEFATKTSDLHDNSELQSILKLTGTKNIESARTKINEEILKKESLIAKESIALIILSIGIFIMFVRNRDKRAQAHFLMVIMSLTLLLLAGVATPMIDMEAKISQLNFMLIGHPILFENQILYFQSKSILDVFFLMITNSQFQMKVVGLLLVTFSAIFPLLKLVSSAVYYFDFKALKNSRIIHFFIFRSGKWSMADVMVVAIFMAYIGFSGIISSQLANMNPQVAGLDIVSTNGTSLQPGYYLFLTYVILALFLSSYLAKQHPAKAGK